MLKFKLINWLFSPSVSIYLADKMTNLTGYYLWKNYKIRKKIYRRHGIRVISPLPGEGIKPLKRKIKDRPGHAGKEIWMKDKEQLKQANIFVFPSVGMTSQGCINELVKARGAHWKPTVYINKTPGFIAKEQNDLICENDCTAARLIIKTFGSRWQRLLWRIQMLNQSIPKWLWQQLREFWL